MLSMKNAFISLISLLFLGFLFPVSGNTIMQLREFPELKTLDVQNIAVLDSHSALLFTQNKIFTWDGKGCKIYLQNIPFDNYKIQFVRCFSKRNIWVFYRKSEFHFHTECYHFDGNDWQKIFLSQPFVLSSISFIDSMRFYAAGDWGSLIFFDGEKSCNMPVEGNMSMSVLRTFSQDIFLGLATSRSGSNTDYILREYLNGRWRNLKTYRRKPMLINLKTFKKNFVLNLIPEENEIKKINDIVIDTLISESLLKNDLSQASDSVTYIWVNDTIWKYNARKWSVFFAIPEKVTVFPLSDKSWLLLNEKHQFYYLGTRNIGEPVRIHSSLFEEYYLTTNEPSGHLSVAAYENRSGETELYFTAANRSNDFINIFANADWRKFVDVMGQRGLYGADETTAGPVQWDGGMFFADLDNDGDLDAVLAVLRGNSQLFENTGNDRFKNVTAACNFTLKGRITKIAFCDLNKDGFLDFFAGDEEGPLKFFLNDGFWSFIDRTDKLGLPDSLTGCLPALADIDNDNDTDLLMYSVFHPVYCLKNTGIEAGKDLPVFRDDSQSSPELTIPYDYYTQSISFVDFDIDGDLDVFLANRVSPCKLFENNGIGEFSDVSVEKGFNQRLFAYGAVWGDINQDGYPDMFLTTFGKNYFFRNRGGAFFEIDSLSVANKNDTYSTGSLLIDIDKDGDLDIVVANNKIGISEILKNKSNRDNYLKFSVEGKKSNRIGIGSKIWVYENGFVGNIHHLRGFQEITTNTGYVSSTLPTAYFGLTADSRYDAVIQFPSGEIQTKTGLSVGNKYDFRESFTFSIFLKQLEHGVKSLWFIRSYRYLLINLSLITALMLVFNLYIFYKHYWPWLYLLFFNGSLLITGMFLLHILSNPSVWYLRFLPVYGILSTGILNYYLIQHYFQLRFKTEEQFEVYDLLRQFNHSQRGMRQIDHLLFCTNNIAKTVDNGVLTQEVKKFESQTLPELIKIEKLLKRWYWGDFRKLQLKFHAKNLKLYSGKILADKNGIAKNGSAIRNMLINLKESLNKARQIVNRSFSVDLFSVLSESLSGFPQFTDYAVLKPAQLDSLAVCIRKDNLAHALGNIFKNSLDAMNSAPEKKLQIKVLNPVDGFVKLIIRDFGPGRNKELTDIIFKEQFSTKNSTGLGLYHAKKLLNEFDADINLCKNQPAIGAELCLRLKVF